MITSGVATGTGLGSYQIFKSFMGQSGTGGDMKTMIAVTTIGTVMGALLGFVVMKLPIILLNMIIIIPKE